jgi:hypothetical protein
MAIGVDTGAVVIMEVAVDVDVVKGGGWHSTSTRLLRKT